MRSKEKYFKLIQKLYRREIRKRNFIGEYEFDNRIKGSENLVIIIAGYQEFLWDSVFRRIEMFTPKDYDVCIVTPGINSEKLRSYSKKHNWSYLYLKEDKLALGQNIVIKLHECARWIYKIDEDIFICNGFFEALKNTYKKVLDDGIYNPGFLAPMLNVNGYSYIPLLKKLRKLEQYEEKFGRAIFETFSAPIRMQASAAIFMWENIFPIDQINKNFMEDKVTYSVCPIRFSIGAIMFTREIWSQMGGFLVGLAGDLGVEEAEFCKYCLDTAQVIVISENVLAGHLGFYT